MTQKPQKNTENLFPVFRFSLENKIVYANQPAQSLMNHWNCAIDQKIPADVIGKYPELFHSALSHKPFDVTIEMGHYNIRFSIVPFPEAGYIGMYAYSMEQNSNFIEKTKTTTTAKVAAQ